MGNLRDELISKGLVSSGRAQQLAHEDRSIRRRQGKAETVRRKQEAAAGQAERERERRRADRDRERARSLEREAAEKAHALAQMVSECALEAGVRGSRKFFFVAREKTLPYLELGDSAVRGLEEGRLAICEVPFSDPQRFVLLDQADAERVAQIDERWILFRNSPGA